MEAFFNVDKKGDKRVDYELLLDTCLLAGEIMLESGSETYRVEDTMERIAGRTGVHNLEVYATATGIIVGIEDRSLTKLFRVKNRTTNLEKIDQTNQASRQFASGEMTLTELNQQLRAIYVDKRNFPQWIRVLSAGAVSAVLMITLGGVYADFLLAFIVGLVGYAVSLKVDEWIGMKFINDLLAVLVIGFMVQGLDKLGLVTMMDRLLIGSLMPLVPGLAITSAMRDLFEGHMITGLVRVAEAVITASIIGIGIVVALRWY